MNNPMEVQDDDLVLSIKKTFFREYGNHYIWLPLHAYTMCKYVAERLPNNHPSKMLYLKAELYHSQKMEELMLPLRVEK
jgi:hypothetical protein